LSLTIDASVFVSAIRHTETGSDESNTFLDALRGSPRAVFCPILVITETVAAIGRVTAGADLAQQAADVVDTLPGIRLVSVDAALARSAARIAAEHRLRGADSIYLAVAVLFGSTLLTWDKEMLERGSAIANTLTPTGWLRELMG
jgi:predicted nucleic acid-binding protein